MQETVGTYAGLVWKVLTESETTLEAKAIKKAAKLTDKKLYSALGWLLREGKVSVKEEGKEVFIALL